MYTTAVQWKAKLLADEITHDELWEMAYAKADERLEKRMETLQGEHQVKTNWAKEDQVFIEEREDQYRKDYDWTVKSDEKILENILSCELQIRRTERKLQDITLPVKERQDNVKTLMELFKLHKELLTAAGIDRISRERKRVGADPIEDWERVKELAHKKMQELEAEFTEKASNARTEAELRDRMKHHLGYPFAIIDAALKAHRRVLGLDENVQVS